MSRLEPQEYTLADLKQACWFDATMSEPHSYDAVLDILQTQPWKGDHFHLARQPEKTFKKLVLQRHL